MPSKKATRQQKTREQARADWIADASPALAATSRQLDPGERDRIWVGLLDRGMVDWAIVLEEAPAQPRPVEVRRRRAPARPASAYLCASVFDPHEEGNICDLLRLALVTRGVSRAYELHEDEGLSHEIDAAAIEVIYNGGSEAAWTDDTFEWAIQVDHEDGVLVVGDWLLADLKGVWPAWRRWHYQEAGW